MTDHIPEWKNIRERYELSLEDMAGIERERIRFRIERISALIESQEKRDKEMNHFR